MPCPICGGEKRDPIAPGYWHCNTMVLDTAWTTGPDPRYPPSMGVMGPVPVQVQRPCGHEYHEADAGGDAMATRESCACSIFAIGRCAECQQPLCGRHGADRSGQFVCQDCRSRLDREEAEAAARAEADRAADAKEKLVSAISARLASLRPTLLAVPDPTLRWMRLWAALTEEPLSSAAAAAPDLLRQLITEVAAGADKTPLRLDTSLRWHLDAAGLMEWVAGMTNAPATTYTTHGTVNGFFRGTKRTGRLAGWRLRSESRSDSSSYRSSSWTVDVVMLVDGTIAEPRAGERKIMSYQPRRQIGLGDLRTVGDLAGAF